LTLVLCKAKRGKQQGSMWDGMDWYGIATLS